MKKTIYVIIGIVIIIGIALFFVYRPQTDEPSEIVDNNPGEVVDNQQPEDNQPGITDSAIPEITPSVKPDAGQKLTADEMSIGGKVYKFSDASQLALAKQLRQAIDAKNFADFTTALRTVYDKRLDTAEAFKALESEMYVYVTENYFVKKNYNESLRLANIVFDKVFESWRFSYMKIVSLKGLGDIEFAKGNLDKADSYAMDILAIEFRPEGADLHAQVNIAKAKIAKAAGKIDEAKALLNDALKYELTADRKAEANKLLSEL